MNNQKLDTEGCIPISYPNGLATLTLFCVQSWWSSSPLSNSIYGLRHLSLHQTCTILLAILSGRHTCWLHITWNLHLSSVDPPADIHVRSHSFLLIHHREGFLAWCWVITRPSSCGVALLWLLLGVGLTGVGLVHLSHTWQTSTHKGMLGSDVMRRSQLWCRMHECPCWSFTSYKGMSIMIWCTTSWGLSSHLSLIFLFPWKASALSRMRSPDFKPMAPILQSYYCFCLWASAIDWAWPLEGWPSISVRQWLHICPHAWQRCHTWGPLHSLRWGSKSQLGACACAQTLNNVGCTPSWQIR